MFTLPYHFKELLTSIEPEEARQEAAEEIPAKVREFLAQSDDIATVEPHSRLAGSYARRTAIKDIKDVDVILFVDPAYGTDCEAEEVLEILFRSLQGLPEALDDEGEVMRRRHQRRSINVHLQRRKFDLDIVPAIATKGVEEPLLIPDKDWGRWVKTHPLGYAQSLSAFNAEHGGKVVPVIKLMKHWRDEHMQNRRPKSYWLECLVYHTIADGAVHTQGCSYAELFGELLSTIYDGFSWHLNRGDAIPQISDPMLGHNVAFNWTRDAFETFMRRVDESRNWAARALNEEDEAKAIELWRKVFGEQWFPVDAVKQMGERLRAAVAAGEVSILVATVDDVRVLTQPPVKGHIPIPPQRFYGQE